MSFTEASKNQLGIGADKELKQQQQKLVHSSYILE